MIVNMKLSILDYLTLKRVNAKQLKQDTAGLERNN